MFRDEAGQPKLPVVEIGANSFKVVGAGTKHAPTFRIVDWIDRAEYNTLSPSAAPAEEQAEEAEVVEAPAKQAAPARTVKAPVQAPKTTRVGGYKDMRGGLK
jgi:hypothetical protein